MQDTYAIFATRKVLGALKHGGRYGFLYGDTFTDRQLVEMVIYYLISRVRHGSSSEDYLMDDYMLDEDKVQALASYLDFAYEMIRIRMKELLMLVGKGDCIEVYEVNKFQIVLLIN